MRLKMRELVVGKRRGIVPMRDSSLYSRRSMLLYGFLGILCLVRTIESGPITEKSNGDESRGETLQSRNNKGAAAGQEEEVGNPSEIAYQAWLLIDGHPDAQPLGGLDSASLLRRIKPKSIFVAPNLTACPEGYQDDTMNRCVKDVNIDHQAHKGFLVQRLQAIFGHKSHGSPLSSSSSSSLSLSSSSSASAVPSGPLQLNIPLIMAAPVKPAPAREKINFPLPNSEQATTTTTDSSKIILEDGKGSTDLVHDDDDDDKKNHENQGAIVTVYELNEDESKFFLGNKSSGNTVETDKSRDPTILVPVADLADVGNGNLPVDYESPTSIDDDKSHRRHNLTILVGGSIDKNNQGTYKDTPNKDKVKEEANEEKRTPTVVLVLSPTNIPSIPVDNRDLVVADNSTLGGQVIIKMENVTSTSNATTKETIRENYEDSGETEDDEILKHSEAGITVPSSTSRQPMTEKSTTVYTDDKDVGSSSEISGEVSINRDFVRETTLVDFNVDSTIPPASPSPIIVEPQKQPDLIDGDSTSSDDDYTTDAGKPDDDISTADQVTKLPADDTSRENEGEIVRNEEEPSWTEKSDSTETMIAASTNDAHQTVVTRDEPKFVDMPSYSSSKKRAGQPFTFEATTKIPHNKPFSTIPNLDGSVYDYYPPRYTPDELDPEVPLIRTIDEPHRYPPTSTDGTHKRYQNFFPSSQHHRDYVNFERHGQPNYVSFPSEEANSIHPNDYKERRPYLNRYQHQFNYGMGSPVTKNPSTQEINKKQSYWWLPLGWPTDKQQQQHQQRQDIQQRTGNDRSRTPMLLRFWTRMPLVRDPSLNNRHPAYLAPPERTSSTRRVNYYKEISTQDFNRAFARKSLPSAIGG